MAQLWPTMGSENMLLRSLANTTPAPSLRPQGCLAGLLKLLLACAEGCCEQLECSLLDFVMLACAEKALKKRDMDEGRVPTCKAP